MSEDARKDEAQDKTAVVEWRNEKFEVPRSYADWSVDFIESLEEGKSAGIVRGAIGPSRWREFKATSPTGTDLDSFARAIAKAMGFASTGESPASSD